MYRATTPTFTFTFPEEAHIEEATRIFVTFAKSNGENILTKWDDQLEANEDYSIGVSLSQEETLMLPAGPIKVQINWIYTEEGAEKRACSQVMTVFASKNLLEEVIHD